MRALSKYRATVSPAPNFAFGLCAEKIRDEELQGVDLSHWHIALCGAETIVPAVLERFIERFEPYGFRRRALTPVYGLSEAALAVTFADLEQPYTVRSLPRRGADAGTETSNGRAVVSVGRPLPGFEIEVRDQTGRVLSGEEEGRIWVRGPSLMRGYLHQADATAAVLRDGWLDTGDLGFVYNRELYVSGRAKDVLIVRGANHSPDEIEAVVGELAEVGSGCAAAVGHLPAGADSEQVWLFVERAKKPQPAEPTRIAERCKHVVLADTGITLDRIEVVEPGTLPRTSSGKIRRRKTLELFLAGELHPPGRATATHKLREMSRSVLAQIRQQREQNAG